MDTLAFEQPIEELEAKIQQLVEIRLSLTGEAQYEGRAQPDVGQSIRKQMTRMQGKKSANSEKN